MKTSKKISKLALLSFLGAAIGLASCSVTPGQTSGTVDNATSGNQETGQSSTGGQTGEKPNSTPSTSEGGNKPDTNTQTSTPVETVPPYTGAPKTFKFYCLNDFHGSIVARSNEVGMKSLFSFLKSKVDEDPEHTIVLSAGDMFQGSWESNSNLGKLIIEGMNAVPFTAGALGNHDFDYGIKALNDMQNLATFPMLAGNIYKYGTQTKWTGSEGSVLVEKDGVKIGIIGNIGQGQTTSIQSTIVQDLDFKDPIPVIKEESKALRAKGAQIIVNVTHDPSKTFNLMQFSGIKEHFDGCFLGHSHQNEVKTMDGVPFVQSGSNGRGYSYFELTIDENGVTPTNANYHTAQKGFKVDPIFETIEKKYLDSAFYAKTNEVLARLSGTNLDKYGVARLGCKAMFEEYKGKHPDLVVTMENSQRATLYTGNITYGKLYQATPFMNKFVVAKVKGSEIKRQARNALSYTGDTTKYATLDDNTFYTAGIIDYVYFHQNTNKDYDYIPSAADKSNLIAVYEDYPVDITARYLKNTLKGQCDGLKFEGTANGFDLYKA